MYNLIETLHILCAIVGFGGVALNSFYTQQIRQRRGAEALAVARSNFKVSIIATYFIYGVFVFGIIMPFTGGKVGTSGFSEPWLSAAILLYIVAIGLLHAVYLPNIRKMDALLAEHAGGGSAAVGDDLDRRGRLGGIMGAILNLIWVVVLFLMVFKPGHVG